MTIENEAIDFATLYRIIRNYKKHVLIIVAMFLTIAVVYIFLATPLYTAETEILLDQSQADVVSDASSAQQQRFSSSQIDSQIEIIKSRSITKLVLEDIKPQPFVDAVEHNDIEQQERIILSTMSGLNVSRRSETYVIEIRYTSTDPILAAEYANSYAKSYVLDQIDSLKGTSSTAAIWLKSRIVDLRNDYKAAFDRARKFRKEHNLYSSNGKLINEDQLKEMNDQLGLARANTATAKAKYEYSKSVVESHDINAAVAEAFDNDVINNIRVEYLSSKKRLSELQRLLGPSHTTVKNQIQELKEYEEIILNEMRRIEQSQLSDYKVSMARETAMESGLSKLIDIKVQNESLLSELQDLELEAETYNAMYKNYIEKYQQLSQRKSLPISESRVISTATPPLNKSHPKVVLIFGVAFILGLGSGLLLAIYLNFTDRSIKTGTQIQELGLSFLGFFPTIKFPDKAIAAELSTTSDFKFLDPLKTITIDKSFSVHAETIRTTRAYVDRRLDKQKEGRIVGIVSCFPHEGKSTVSTNLALSLAKTNRCLLIDADIRNPSLTKSNFTNELVGLGHVLKGEVGLDEPLIKETSTGLSILSAQCDNVELTLKEFNPKLLGNILKRYSETFDYIVVDLPPFNATSDAFSLAPYIDRYLIVAEWSKTKANDLSAVLNANEIDTEKVIGVILNKADMTQLVKFHGYHVYTNNTYFSSTSALVN